MNEWMNPSLEDNSVVLFFPGPVILSQSWQHQSVASASASYHYPCTIHPLHEDGEAIISGEIYHIISYIDIDIDGALLYHPNTDNR